MYFTVVEKGLSQKIPALVEMIEVPLGLELDRGALLFWGDHENKTNGVDIVVHETNNV
jgi:hypothetical protein